MRMKKRVRAAIDPAPNLWRQVPRTYPFVEDTAMGEEFRLTCGCFFKHHLSCQSGVVAKITKVYRGYRGTEARDCVYHAGKNFTLVPKGTVVRL